MRLRIAASVGCLFLSTACPESCLHQTAPNSYAQREAFHQAAAAANLASRTAPVPQHPGKGIFGDQIQYLGYDLDPAQPKSGAPLVVTFYFHALHDVTRDWEIFVHIDERNSQSERVNGDHFPVSGRFHTDQWKQGDYIADRFAFTLAAYQPHGVLDFWTGFYQDDERLPISDPADCPNDGNNRLLAATLQLE